VIASARRSILLMCSPPLLPCRNLRLPTCGCRKQSLIQTRSIPSMFCPYALSCRRTTDEAFCSASRARALSRPLLNSVSRASYVTAWSRIASHTEAEVRDILLALERTYHPSFPELNLRQWTRSIYTWLTHPLTASTKERSCDHGPSDAARHDGPGVVLCAGGERCQSQTSQGSSRAPDPSS
jgi:hypothetical protein